MSAVAFENVSKTFSRHAGQVLLRQHLFRFFRRNAQDRFYALKNVSFRVEKGESLAVIGGNGAGKSTLLGLVAGLAKPDEGTVAVNGHVAALLELGSGFHPDLTGRENVHLNASLLGMTRALARELGPAGIRVNAISPGAIPTDAERVHADPAAYARWVLERQSLKFRGTPEDVADAVLFLLSDRSRFITGQNLDVNGGWLMN